MTIPYETINKIPKRLKKVEEIFEVAENVLEECVLPDEDEDETCLEVMPANESSLVDSNSVKIPRLFALSEIRQDFILSRRNLYKLMGKCQTMMDGVSGMDIQDLNGSQIEAISSLANSINMQIRTVMMLYGELANIEKLRTPPEYRPKDTDGNKNDDRKNDGTVYIGDTKSLMDIIRENT